MNRTRNKIADQETLSSRLAELERPIVFTNGCFDILHRGHIAYLQQAARLGKSLVVGVNSDASIQRLDKSSDRPINSLSDRLAVLSALEAVDLVIAFEEDTPINLIKMVNPDQLVKGAMKQPVRPPGSASACANPAQCVPARR